MNSFKERISSIIKDKGINDFLRLAEYRPLIGAAARANINLIDLADAFGQTILSKSDYYLNEFKKLVLLHGVKTFDCQYLQDNNLINTYHSLQKNCDLSWTEIARHCGIEQEYKIYADLKKNESVTTLIKNVSSVYEKYGLVSLTRAFYSQHSEYKYILNAIYNHGMSFEKFAEKLNVREDFHRFITKNRKATARTNTINRGQSVWTEERFERTTKEIIDKYNGLPPKQFLEQNGYSGYNRALHLLGYTFTNIREKYKVPTPERMRDMDGKYFKSFCETALSNFLLARDVSTRNGKRYSNDFAAFTNNVKSKAYYDLHFVSPITLQQINVEIFGGGGSLGNVDGQAKYEQMKSFKMEFHKSDKNFLAINWKDCYQDKDLEKILKPFIGDLPIVRAPKFYQEVSSTSWSLLDEVIRVSQDVCKQLKRELPAVSWFRRDRNYAGRDILNFERQSWEGFVDSVFKVGGFVFVRRLMKEMQSSCVIKHKLTEDITDG